MQLGFFLVVSALIPWLSIAYEYDFDSRTIVDNEASPPSSLPHYEILDGSLYKIDNYNELLNRNLLKKSTKVSSLRLAIGDQRQKQVWELISTFDSFKNSSSFKNDEYGKPTLDNFKYIVLPIWWSDQDTTDPSKKMNPATVVLPFEENQAYYIDMSWGKMTNGVTWKLLPQEMFDISSISPNFHDTDSRAREILSQKGFKKGVDYDGICLTYYTSQSGPFSGSGGWGSVNGEQIIGYQ